MRLWNRRVSIIVGRIRDFDDNFMQWNHSDTSRISDNSKKNHILNKLWWFWCFCVSRLSWRHTPNCKILSTKTNPKKKAQWKCRFRKIMKFLSLQSMGKESGMKGKWKWVSSTNQVRLNFFLHFYPRLTCAREICCHFDSRTLCADN